MGCNLLIVVGEPLLLLFMPDFSLGPIPSGEEKAFLVSWFEGCNPSCLCFGILVTKETWVREGWSVSFHAPCFLRIPAGMLNQ